MDTEEAHQRLLDKIKVFGSVVFLSVTRRTSIAHDQCWIVASWVPFENQLPVTKNDLHSPYGSLTCHTGTICSATVEEAYYIASDMISQAQLEAVERIKSM